VTGLGPKPVEAAPAHLDGDDVGVLQHDPAHHEAVLHRGEDREDEPEREQSQRDEREQRQPVPPLPGALSEEARDRELVRQREADGCVRREVDDVPHLVRQAALHRHDRCDRYDRQGDEPDHAQQEVGDAQERGELGDDADRVLGGVAADQEDRVEQQPEEDPLAKLVVQRDRAVVADCAIDVRDACGQDEHDHHEVRGHEAGDDSTGDKDFRAGGHGPDTTVGDPQPQRGRHRSPCENGEHVALEVAAGGLQPVETLQRSRRHDHLGRDVEWRDHWPSGRADGTRSG